MVSEKKSLLKRILITVICLILTFCIVSMAATKIVYDHIFTRVDEPEISVPDTLSQMVENRTEKEYYSGENLLSGYLYESGIRDRYNSLIVLAPGFNAGADSYLWQISELNNRGWSVFAFDPTGCYSSQGESTVGFAQEIIDLDNTLKYIEKNNRFGYNDIVIMGHSRGGYAACCNLAYGHNVSAVISVSGINSAMDGIMGASVNYVGGLAYLNYGFLWLYQTMLFGADTVNLSADEEISKSDVPVLIVHGEQDKQVPLSRYSIISQKDKIKSKNVEYYVCSQPESNGHTDLLFDSDGTANDKLFEQIERFLKQSAVKN